MSHFAISDVVSLGVLRGYKMSCVDPKIQWQVLDPVACVQTCIITSRQETRFSPSSGSHGNAKEG
jgi:hypothetical protein